MSLSGLNGMYLCVEASEDNPLSHLVKFLGTCVVLTGNRLLHILAHGLFPKSDTAGLMSLPLLHSDTDSPSVSCFCFEGPS